MPNQRRPDQTFSAPPRSLEIATTSVCRERPCATTARNADPVPPIDTFAPRPAATPFPESGDELSDLLAMLRAMLGLEEVNGPGADHKTGRDSRSRALRLRLLDYA